MHPWHPLFITLSAILFLPFTSIAVRLGSGRRGLTTYARAAIVIALLVACRPIAESLSGAGNKSYILVDSVLFCALISSAVDLRVAWHVLNKRYRENRTLSKRNKLKVNT
jgi:hypothetical protein